MRVISAVGRWRGFIDGPVSVGSAIVLAAAKAVGVRLPKRQLPLVLRGQPIPVFCRVGTSDFHTLLQIWDQGEYDLVHRFVRAPVHRVLDLGSNVGFSVRYLSALWPEAKFVAVEPDGSNYQQAKRNLADLLRSNRVSLTRAFVSADRGFARIESTSTEEKNQFRMGEPQGKAVEGAVPVVTVPDLITQFGDHPIDFLKCDIEGSEHELFADHPGWIRRVRSLVVELHGIAPNWLWAAIEGAGVEVLDRKVQPIPGYDLSLAWARLKAP